MEPTITAQTTTTETNTKRRLAVILSGIVLIVLVALVGWLVMNLNNNIGSQTPIVQTSSSRNNSVVNVDSTQSSTTSMVTAAKPKPFELSGKVFNPFVSAEANVKYAGEVLDVAKVELISSEAVGTAADDLAISTAEYELTVQVQWDSIDTFIPKSVGKTNVANPNFANLFRLNIPDTDTTNQYTYLNNLRTTNCDVEPEANEECADSFIKLNDRASLLIRCQAIQVTGLAECDRVVSTLRVTI